MFSTHTAIHRSMRTQEPQHDGDMNPIVSDDMESQRNPLKRHITGEEPITPNASTGTYTWQFFDGSTRPCERALEPALPGARNLCCVMGLLGVRIIRVTDKQSEIDGGVQFSHFLSTDVPRRGVWRTVSNAFLMICLLPVSISLTVTALPLHELKEPIGSDGLLPLSEYWGWIFQTVLNNFFASCIFFGMQCIYLNPTDHFFFRLWPSIIHLILIVVIQDFIPRIMGLFPVPFLFNIAGALLVILVVLFNSYTFVTTELPKYEKGLRQHGSAEVCISFGNKTAAQKKRKRKQAIRALRGKDDESSFVLRPQGSSKCDDDLNLSDGKQSTDYIPSYIVFRRRRMLTLSLIILAYAVFYWICVVFLLLFRFHRDSDSLQVVFAISFSLTSTLFRKFIVPYIFDRAKFGGKLWDGEFHDRFPNQFSRYDDRVNASAFRLADFFFESLSEVFITFILPEANSVYAVIFLVVGELFVILFTGASWVLLLPKGWKKREVSPQDTAEAQSASKLLLGITPTMKGPGKYGQVDEKWGSNFVRKLAGIPSYGRLRLLAHKLFHNPTGHVATIDSNVSHCQDMSIIANSWQRLVCIDKMFRMNYDSDRFPLELLKTFRRTPSEIIKKWVTNWLVPLIPLERHTKRARRQRRHSVAVMQHSDSSSCSCEMTSGHTCVADEFANTNSPKSVVTRANMELTMVAWITSRCQTLFVMFAANIYAGISFFVMFPYLSFGNNRNSFPYSDICHNAFYFVLLYNFLAIVTVLIGIGLVDHYLRNRLGMRFVHVGLAYFMSRAQAIFPVVLSGIISFALVWSFLIDHVSSLVFLTETFGDFEVRQC